MNQYVQKKQLNDLEGDCLTSIEDVRFYRNSKGHPRRPTMYKSGLIILGQGQKAVYAGGQRIPYGEGDCLVMGVPMPVECQAYYAVNKPLLGVGIEIPLNVLQKQANIIKDNAKLNKPAPPLSKFSIRKETIDEKLSAACERLLEVLCDDIAAEVLGKAMVEQVAYYALMSQCGDVLFNLADQEGKYARIASTLQFIHTHYSQPLHVSKLASKANMSVSSFHTAFRNVTLESPIQYIKKVRLNKARELICFEDLRVNETAERVGYSSAAQFSREFKRFFNHAPKEAKVCPQNAFI